MSLAARMFTGILAFLIMTGGTLYAQPDETSSEDEKTDSSEQKPSWDRLIYVPFRELEKVFNNQEASAVIPYLQYLHFLKIASGATDAVEEKSPEAVLTRADYRATVEQDVVRIDARFEATVLKKEGWAKLPVRFGNVSVGSLKTDQEDRVILRGSGEGQYELLFQGAGEHTVELQLLAAVKTSPESRSFAVECPPVGITELTIVVPEAEQAIQVAPLQVLLPAENESPDSQTVARASLGAIERFEVTWNPKAGSRPLMDLLTSVSNQTSARIETGLIQTTTVLNYEILRGELRDLTVQVPVDARIIDVTSSNGRIAGWKTEKKGDTHQEVQIELLAPVTDRLQVTLQTERSPEGDTIQLVGVNAQGQVQGVHAQQVIRESGQITVTTDPSLTLVVREQSGVKRTDNGAAGAAKGRQPSAQTWEFSGTTGRLVVQVRPVEPRLLVDQTAQVVFEDDLLRVTSRLTYSVERAGVFELRLSYPESLSIDRVQADGMSEFHVDKAAGQLTLSLARKRMGKINVEVVAHQKFDSSAENAETEIPVMTPVGVEREEGRILLFAPQFLNVSTVEEKTSGIFPEQSAAARIGRAVQVANWKYTQRPFSLVVRTSPRPSQVAASVATTATIEPKRIEFDTLVRFDIRNAGIDTLRLAVPEAVADRVSFSAVSSQHRIQQMHRAAQAQDGWVTWTLVLPDEVTGIVDIKASWITSQDEDDESAERKVVLEPVRVLPPFEDGQANKRKVTLAKTRGEIRLLRHDSLSISATGSGETIEQIDVRELQLLPRDGYLAFRYFSQPVSVEVSIRRHEIHEVVQTVVSRAAVEIVTDKQPIASYRARYRVTSSERQRLRVDVPAGADLQAPLIDSRRTTFEAADVTAEDGWDAYYVNVSREGDSDQPFLLTLQFRCPIAEAGRFPYEKQGGRQILRLPLIGDQSGATVVQETRAAVWAPRDIAFVGEPDHWTIVGRQSWSLWNPLVSPSSEAEADALNQWIGGGSVTDFARQGNVNVYRTLGSQPQMNVVWWNRTFLVSIISVAVLLAGFILRRTTWENRLTLVVVAGLIVALWMLKDASEALQFLSAGSLALMTVAGIWLVGLITGSDSASPGSAPPAASGRSSDSGAARARPVSAASSSGQNGAAVAKDSPPLPPGTVCPSPEVVQWMNELMGGK